VPALCEQAVHVTDPGTIRDFYSQDVRLALKVSLPVGQAGPISFRSKYLPIGLRRPLRADHRLYGRRNLRDRSLQLGRAAAPQAERGGRRNRNGTRGRSQRKLRAV
jgi:hypothetical protein